MRITKLVNKYLLIFIAYSFIGWVYEVILVATVYNHGFSNRGFLYGPYLPVYGFAALLIILMLSNIKDKEIMFLKINISIILVFIGAFILATISELVASYILEAISGEWLWDYTNYKYNFEGRIALNASFIFGFGGVLFVYVIQPKLDYILDKYPDKLELKVGLVMITLILLDLMTILL